MREMNWSVTSLQDVLASLHTYQNKGLTRAEASQRRERYGLNRLAEERKVSVLKIFASQFSSALIYILVIAATVSFVLGHHTDAWVILAAVIVNVIVGFIQEFRAERALEALKKIVTFSTTIIRDGREQSVEPTQLVPGDIVKLEAGAKVPADVRIIESDKLSINEAPLTGESVAVAKDHKTLKSAVIISEKNNMAFFGTTVVGGSGKAVVIATGKETEIGRIAKLVSETERETTPLQEKLQKFSRTIAVIILGVSFIIFVIGVFLGKDVADMFTTAVALAVAAIPEGLVVVLTVILAVGMQRILKQHALVRKLVAAETLGSTTVICTDKTGTLTEGEMHVVRVLTEQHDVTLNESSTQHPESVFKALTFGLLSSDAYLENPKDALHKWRIFGDPTERALVAASAKFGILKEDAEKSFPRIDSIPFDSEKKYMTTLHKRVSQNLLIFKGAPEILLEHVTSIDRDNHVGHVTNGQKKLLKKQYQSLSSEGLRILGIGYKEMGATEKLQGNDEEISGMTFLGFFCLQDPLREDVIETLQTTVNSGIRTVMLTGDHKLTAQAIARAVGLPAEPENIIDGHALENLSQEELDKRIGQLYVYARVNPKDKLRIIDAWQRKAAVVAMTGDGVNDAPALKSADIGIALGSGTDVAKETADMVLLQNNFSVIIRAIEEGRVIFSNIKKVILYLMSDSFTEIVLIALSLFFGLPLPLLASQILWVNLVSDGLPALALTMEEKEEDVMKDAPVPRGEAIFSPHMRQSIIVISLFTGVLALVIFYFFWKVTGDLDRARTVTFMAVTFDSLIYVFSVRVMRRPIWQQSFFRNRWLVASIVIAFIVLLVAVYLPAINNLLRLSAPHGVEWLIAIGYALFHGALFETLKYIYRKKNPAKIL